MGWAIKYLQFHFACFLLHCFGLTPYEDDLKSVLSVWGLRHPPNAPPHVGGSVPAHTPLDGGLWDDPKCSQDLSTPSHPTQMPLKIPPPPLGMTINASNHMATTPALATACTLLVVVFLPRFKCPVCGSTCDSRLFPDFFDIVGKSRALARLHPPPAGAGFHRQ